MPDYLKRQEPSFSFSPKLQSSFGHKECELPPLPWSNSQQLRTRTLNPGCWVTSCGCLELHLSRGRCWPVSPHIVFFSHNTDSHIGVVGVLSFIVLMCKEWTQRDNWIICSRKRNPPGKQNKAKISLIFIIYSVKGKEKLVSYYMVSKYFPLFERVSDAWWGLGRLGETSSSSAFRCVTHGVSP